MKSLFITLICLLTTALYAQNQSQIKVLPPDGKTLTTDLIINGLVSSGIKILDIKTNFEPESHVMGFFNDPVRFMGIKEGMILSTGVVDNVDTDSNEDNYSSTELGTEVPGQKIIIQSGPQSDNPEIKGDSIGLGVSGWNFFDCNSSKGDADLSAEIEGLRTFDARVIEIKFIPTADTFYYRYVFASEEYDEYVCSEYNDIFAFYIYEEGGKKINTAIVPNQKLPVSINTINGGNTQSPGCKSKNSYLYQRNDGRQRLLFDGFTKVLDIRYKVTPGKVYNIKIAIADASDCVWDSAVLLENNSIFSYFKSFETRFGSNSADPTDPAAINEVVKYIEKHPDCKIHLIGHSDRTGSFDHNFDLSVKRVEAVQHMLIAKGIKADRIQATFKGELMPRYEEIAKNRRVEIFIMGQ